jgi:cutinase
VLPSIAVEGVEYGAGVAGNMTPGGGDPAGIKEATKDYTLAFTKCPNTIIIGGGYSQGAAITHRTVEALPENIKARIAGITLYGDTKYKQDGGRIKNFPTEKVKIFCNGYGELKGKSADGVCNGGLNVNGGHMSYGDSFKPGAAWLKAQVDAFKSSGGAAAPAAAAPAAAAPAKASSGKAAKAAHAKAPPAKSD